MDVRLDCAPHVGATLVVARGSEGFCREAPCGLPKNGRGSRHKTGFRQAQQAPPLHRLLVGRTSRRLLDKKRVVHANPSLVTWAESFIFAGSSALLLLITNLFPEYWYFSFFALTPFLYKIIKASSSESLRLGFLFGLSFFGVSLVNSPITSPLPPILYLVFGTGLFTIFGWTAGWARNRWGFTPSIVALLWIGLEIGLVKLGFVNGLLGKAELSHPFVGGLVGLFGFLAVSTIIVLLNALLVLLIVKTLEIVRAWGKRFSRSGCEATRHLFSTVGLLAQKVYFVPEGRAPPYIIA